MGLQDSSRIKGNPEIIRGQKSEVICKSLPIRRSHRIASGSPTTREFRDDKSILVTDYFQVGQS
jgi:hypothetical protein